MKPLLFLLLLLAGCKTQAATDRDVFNLGMLVVGLGLIVHSLFRSVHNKLDSILNELKKKKGDEE